MIIAGFAFAALCLSANAQENGNRDENGKIVRGAYETNGFGANWFIGVGGGINLGIDDLSGNTHRTGIAPAIDVTVGKWFTPSVGARVGIKGLGEKGWSSYQTACAPTWNANKEMYAEKTIFGLAHADLMWNISNAFSGYKETRTWDVIPYASAGMLATLKGAKGFEIALGAGLLNRFRITDRLFATVDLSAYYANGEWFARPGKSILASATAGLGVNLGKTNWSRGCSEAYAAATAAAAALAAANAALADQNGKLKAENEALKNRPAQVIDKTEYVNKALNTTPGTFYFIIGKATLNEKEAAHLDFYINNAVANAPAGSKFVVTGYADKATGTKAINEKLAQQRAEYVAKLLKAKGVSEDDITIANGGAVTGPNPVLLRSAVVEF